MPCPATRQQEARAIVRTAAPIASAAALPAQPLAACPLRVASALQAGNVCGINSLAQGPQICHCEAPKGPWQSPVGSYNFADGFLVIRPGSARFPRRFAPRNDKPGTIPVLTNACTNRQCPTGRRGHRPLQGVCGRRSATKPAACKALTERRYRRNRFVRFCRWHVRVGSIAPGPAVRSPVYGN